MARENWQGRGGWVLCHQIIERARRAREGCSRMSWSMGASHGRYVLHDGACRSWAISVKCWVIPCASVRQNPGRARRGWVGSIVSLCVSTDSISSGASITDGMTILLVPECFPCVWGLPLAEHALPKAQGAASRERQSSMGMLNSRVELDSDCGWSVSKFCASALPKKSGRR